MHRPLTWLLACFLFPNVSFATGGAWWGNGSTKGVRSILSVCRGCHSSGQDTTHACEGACDVFFRDIEAPATLLTCTNGDPHPYTIMNDIVRATQRTFDPAHAADTYEMPPGNHGFPALSAGDKAILNDYVSGYTMGDCTTPPAPTIGSETAAGYSATWTDPVNPTTGRPTKAGVKSILAQCMVCHKPITEPENLCFCDKVVKTGLPPWLDFTTRESMGRAAYYTPGLTKIEAILVRAADGTMPPNYSSNRGPTAFTELEMQTIQAWIDAGMPN